MRFSFRTLIGAALALVLAFVAVPRLAVAAGTTATVSWIPPTTYVDTIPLPLTDIASVTVSWSRTAGGPVVGSVTVVAPATSTTVPTPCGGYEFTATVTTTATATYPNTTSSPSGPVTYASGVKCTPNPVTGLTVT